MKLSIAALFPTVTPIFAKNHTMVGEKGGKIGMVKEECSLGLDLGRGKKGTEPRIVSNALG
jgi:hypothetical protein